MKHYTGSDLGKDFRDFFRKEKSRITKALKKLGATDIQMSRQFYYFYGYFTTKEGQAYYFSISDVRHSSDDKMLYRIVKDYKDSKGGSNQYCSLEKLDFKL